MFAQQLLAIEPVLAKPESSCPVGAEQLASLPQQQTGGPETLGIEIHQPGWRASSAFSSVIASSRTVPSMSPS